MLPSAHRLTTAGQFRQVVRRGRRGAAATLVAHVLTSAADSTSPSGRPVRVGFVVSRAVGGAVVRNQVVRRLRHQVRPRLADLPDGSMLVVRALPPAAGASSEELGRDLDRAIEGALRRRARDQAAAPSVSAASS